MRSMYRFAITALALTALCSPALADGDDAAADMQSLRDGQAALQTEVAELRKELAEMRKEMQQMLVQLKAAQAQSKPAQPKPRQRPAMDLLGKDAPKHTFKTHQGNEVTIGGPSDKVTLAFFYASWCGFCKRSLPGIEKIYETYKDKGVDVIAINLDDREGKRAKTEEETLKHYESLGLTMPVFLDGKKEVGRPYKVSSFPTSFIIGKNGKVEAVHIGGPTDLDKQIVGELDQLLAGKSLLEEKKDDQPKTQ